MTEFAWAQPSPSDSTDNAADLATTGFQGLVELAGRVVDDYPVTSLLVVAVVLVLLVGMVAAISPAVVYILARQKTERERLRQRVELAKILNYDPEGK